jgi:hypothetical protein
MDVEGVLRECAAGLAWSPLRYMRDYKIDFLRGVALLMIFINHVQGDPFSGFMLHAFAFCDASELFFFLSGFVAGRVYERISREGGWGVAAAKLSRRAGLIYVSQLLLVLGILGLGALAFRLTGETSILQELRLAALHESPCAYVPALLMMSYHGAYFDILPPYVLFLLMLAAILPLLRRSLPAVFVLSAALYVAVTVYDFNFLTEPYDVPWLFNPSAWQFLFFSGVVLGWLPRQRVEAVLTSPLLVALAAAVFLVFWVLDVGFRNAYIPVYWPPDSLWVEKPNLGPLTLLNFVAVFIVFWRLLPPGETLLRSEGASAIIRIGQHALPVFAFGVLLATIGNILYELTGYQYYGERNVPLTLFVIFGTFLHFVFANSLHGSRPERAPAALSQPGR